MVPRGQAVQKEGGRAVPGICVDPTFQVEGFGMRSLDLWHRKSYSCCGTGPSHTEKRERTLLTPDFTITVGDKAEGPAQVH